MKTRILTLLITLLTLGLSCQAQKSETGMASFYGDAFEGKPTASGEPYRASGLTAAHRTLPFGTRVRVTNLSNDRPVILKIKDRVPLAKTRTIDLSRAAAVKLDYIDKGVTRVRIEVLEKP